MSQQRCRLKIEVVNVTNDGWAGVFYVGRGEPRSYLANQFRISLKHSRADVIMLYSEWLTDQIKIRNWNVINELLKICDAYRQGVDVKLGCWCAPSACHGDVIRQCVIQWVRTDYDLTLKAERDKVPDTFETRLGEWS